jgi:hypothetical protein
MNDISKTNIQTKLVKAMAAENIGPSETARIFGIPPTYISMMKNPQAWDKCPKSAWEAVLLWINSGQGLKEYSEKHGKVLPEKHEPVLHHGTIPGSKAWRDEIAEQTGNPIQRNLIVEAKNEYAPQIPETIKTTLNEEVEFRRSMMGKEQADKAQREIDRLMNENSNLIKELNMRSLPEVIKAREEGAQKVCIDIEINLIINGKKIEMK